MEEALNTDIHAINFVKSNSVNDRFFLQFGEDKDLRALLLHTEVRFLTNGLSLVRLMNSVGTINQLSHVQVSNDSLQLQKAS